MAKPTLGYWKIRGLASMIRYLLAYCNVDFEDVTYEQGDGPDFSREVWLSKKFELGLDFPNLPYFIDGDFKMTESVPIMTYICDKFKPELLGKDAEQKAKIGMLLGAGVGPLKGAVTMPCYRTGSKEEVLEGMKTHLPNILKYKGENKFLVGSDPTYIDFYFWEIVEFLAWVTDGQVFVDHPSLKAYHEAFEALPGLKDSIA